MKTFTVLTVAVILLLIAARPAHSQTETVLYSFTGSADGRNPYSPLTADASGNLYGTTFSGGAFGNGAVFELSPNGKGGWDETVLYSFTGGADGSNPWFSRLVFDSKGNLYGTTYFGGQGQLGVVFELTPNGSNWTETVIHEFSGIPDGVYPVNGLVMDSSGNLYGTTYAGGQGTGSIFEVSPSGDGWTEQVIYDGPAGADWGGVTLDGHGNVFGVTPSSVFELSPNGTGGWTTTTVHNFGPGNVNGGPADTPVFDRAGNLYGTTTGAYTDGKVYKLTPGENGKWTRTFLHRFGGGKTNDGSNPWPSVAIDASGNIYGTTIAGGKYGDGIIYELKAPVGAGNYKEKILCNFNGKNGNQPWGSVILDSSGNIYGTADIGGSSNAGVVFEVTP